MADASTCETCGRPVLDPKGCDYDRLIIHGPACICADCRHWCRAPRLPCLPVDWHYRALAAEAERAALRAEVAQWQAFADGEVDVDGTYCDKGVRYLGKAKRQPDGTWQCLADVGGALCRVECRISPRKAGGA